MIWNKAFFAGLLLCLVMGCAHSRQQESCTSADCVNAPVYYLAPTPSSSQNLPMPLSSTNALPPGEELPEAPPQAAEEADTFPGPQF